MTLGWEDLPRPSLVVEVHSPGSRSYDAGKKRRFYLEENVAEYWMIDGKRRTITVVRPGEEDRVVSDVMTWQPAHATSSLTFSADALFG
jgi:Uma2 family endonuclease